MNIWILKELCYTSMLRHPHPYLLVCTHDVVSDVISSLGHVVTLGTHLVHTPDRLKLQLICNVNDRTQKSDFTPQKIQPEDQFCRLSVAFVSASLQSKEEQDDITYEKLELLHIHNIANCSRHDDTTELDRT